MNCYNLLQARKDPNMHDESVSREQLDEIRKRCEAATPGPWVSYLEDRDQLSGESFIARGANPAEEDLYLSGATDHDIEFIAHARQDIPVLLAEIERLRMLLDKKT